MATCRALALSLAVIAAFCAPHPPPATPAPEPPRYVHISVWADGKLVGDNVTYATLTPEPTGVALEVVHFDDPAGPRLSVTLPANVPYGWGAKLHVEAPDYEPLDERITLQADWNSWLVPADAHLPAIVVAGDRFALANGERFYGIEASDFNLFARYVKDGPDAIRTVLLQRKDLGYNMLRVWTRMELAQFGIGNLNPADYPDFYERWGRFLSFVSRYGFYVDATAYTGRDVVAFFDASHWGRLCAASRNHSNVILSLVNENDQSGNHVDTSQFSKCPGIPSSRGSMGAGAWPDALPLWDWTEYHSNGLSEWQRKVGHEAREIALTYHLPVHASENTRDDNDDNPNHFEDAAKGSALLNAAATFHSVNGKNSTLWTGDSLVKATVWALGAKLIPLYCQALPYNRLEPGLFLRIYRGDDDPACTAAIRR